MQTSTKKLAQAALLLALCLISQYFKNLSVYLTGPVINAVLLIAALSIGVQYGVILSVITPVTAFLIAGSPIMAGIPLVIPAIMAGNILYVVIVWLFQKKLRRTGIASIRLPLGMLTASLCKAAFMGVVIVLVLLPLFGNNIAAHLPKPEALPLVLATAKMTFSVTQLVTALLGSLLAYLIWLPLRKYLAGQKL